MNQIKENKIIESEKIDKNNISYNKIKKIPVFLKIILVIFIILLLGIFVFSFKVVSVGKDIFQSDKENSFLTQIKRLILDDDKKIEGENDGRTNILLLGMGGEGHEGALLTDTIMVVSIKYNGDSPPNVALISIPRDLAVPINSSNYVKINSIYAYGTMNNKEEESAGNKLITNYINRISGLPIHYYIQVDFDGFKQIIDSIDGIEVDVKNSFYDPMYPTENFGYQKISFEKGITKMDGDMALKYARSRHGIVTEGEDTEGSDFARAKRQQQILTALKDKTFSVSTIINPKKVNEILNALGNHARTNLKPWEILRLADISKNIQNDKVVNKIIDQESGLLKTTTGRNNAYLLMPNDKEYYEIKQVFKNIFNPEEITNEEKKVNIVILNGTSISGLAKKSVNQLDKHRYNILYSGNTSQKDYEKSVVYDLTNGAMSDYLEILINKFNANLSKIPYNNKLSQKSIDDIEKADFIVILGLNSGT